LTRSNFFKFQSRSTQPNLDEFKIVSWCDPG